MTTTKSEDSYKPRLNRLNREMTHPEFRRLTFRDHMYEEYPQYRTYFDENPQLFEQKLKPLEEDHRGWISVPSSKPQRYDA